MNTAGATVEDDGCLDCKPSPKKRVKSSAIPTTTNAQRNTDSDNGSEGSVKEVDPYSMRTFDELQRKEIESLPELPKPRTTEIQESLKKMRKRQERLNIAIPEDEKAMTRSELLRHHRKRMIDKATIRLGIACNPDWRFYNPRSLADSDSDGSVDIGITMKRCIEEHEKECNSAKGSVDFKNDGSEDHSSSCGSDCQCDLTKEEFKHFFRRFGVYEEDEDDDDDEKKGTATSFEEEWANEPVVHGLTEPTDDEVLRSYQKFVKSNAIQLRNMGDAYDNHKHVLKSMTIGNVHVQRHKNFMIRIAKMKLMVRIRGELNGMYYDEMQGYHNVDIGSTLKESIETQTKLKEEQDNDTLYYDKNDLSE